MSLLLTILAVIAGLALAVVLGVAAFLAVLAAMGSILYVVVEDERERGK